MFLDFFNEREGTGLNCDERSASRDFRGEIRDPKITPDIGTGHCCIRSQSHRPLPQAKTGGVFDLAGLVRVFPDFIILHPFRAQADGHFQLALRSKGSQKRVATGDGPSRAGLKGRTQGYGGWNLAAKRDAGAGSGPIPRHPSLPSVSALGLH